MPSAFWAIRRGSSAALSTQAWEVCLFTVQLFANTNVCKTVAYFVVFQLLWQPADAKESEEEEEKGRRERAVENISGE